jgi:hypothetical protein
MKIKDKKIGEEISVSCRECPTYACYWPRPDPGTFTQGQGYRHRSNDWLCGNREIHGCPDQPVKRDEVEASTITAAVENSNKHQRNKG